MCTTQLDDDDHAGGSLGAPEVFECKAKAVDAEVVFEFFDAVSAVDVLTVEVPDSLGELSLECAVVASGYSGFTVAVQPTSLYRKIKDELIRLND